MLSIADLTRRVINRQPAAVTYVAYLITDKDGNPLKRGVVNDVLDQVKFSIKDHAQRNTSFSGNLIDMENWCYRNGFLCTIDGRDTTLPNPINKTER